MLYTWTISEFLLGSTPKLEEVGSKPDFFDMSLVTALSYDLLHCVLLLTLLVLTQPDQAETSTPQQLYLIEPIRETVSKCLNLLFAHIVGVLLLFFPFELYLFQRVILFDLELFGAVILTGSKGMLRGGFVSEELMFFPGRLLNILGVVLFYLDFL